MTCTFAKGDGFAGTGSTLPQVAIPSDFRLNYGALAGIAHNAVGITIIADSPFGKGKKYLPTGIAKRTDPEAPATLPLSWFAGRMP